MEDFDGYSIYDRLMIVDDQYDFLSDGNSSPNVSSSNNCSSNSLFSSSNKSQMETANSSLNDSSQLKFSPLKSTLRTPDVVRRTSTYDVSTAEVADEKQQLSPFLRLFSIQIPHEPVGSLDTPPATTSTTIKQELIDTSNQTEDRSSSSKSNVSELISSYNSPLPVFCGDFAETLPFAVKQEEIAASTEADKNSMPKLFPHRKLVAVNLGDRRVFVRLPTTTTNMPSLHRPNDSTQQQASSSTEISSAPAENGALPYGLSVKTIQPVVAQHLNEPNQPLTFNVTTFQLTGQTKCTSSQLHHCQQCGQLFRYLSSLREHELGVHTENHLKPYYCPICNKGFVRQTRFRDHVYTHSGFKPYSCHLCCIRFTSRDNAMKHAEVCSGVKDLKCTHCSIILPNHSIWLEHMNGACPKYSRKVATTSNSIYRLANRLPVWKAQRRPTKFRQGRAYPPLIMKHGVNNKGCATTPLMNTKTVIILNNVAGRPTVSVTDGDK